MRHSTNRGSNIITILWAGAAVFLLASSMALADSNTGAQPVPTAQADEKPAGSAPDDFGPVNTKFMSLANVAPGVYSYFNDGAVFGLPGTRVGSITERTQLTNDWGGLRTEWARKGVFLNLYNTTAYQQVSGGLDPGGSVISNTELSLNLDTGRLGWWSGGFIALAAEARFGSDNSKVYGAGTLVPTYYGAVLPQPAKDNNVLFTNLFLEQVFGKTGLGLIAGVIPGLYVPDRMLFGDDWRRYFGNYNFNENAIFTQFYNPQTTTLTGTYSPNEKLNFSLGVYDPNTDVTDISKDFFSEINIYGQGTYSYEAFGLPGQVLVGGLWSNQEKLNLRDPVNISNAGAPPTKRPVQVNLTGNFTYSSWFVMANFSQYLYIKTAPEKRREIMARGDPLRGFGIFGRIGYSPPQTTAITNHFSLALLANGLIDGRPNDSFGIGVSYNTLSGDLKNGVRVFSGGDISIDDESVTEVFYNVGITPAIYLNTSYQHVWNPFTAALAGGDDSADILMVRLSTIW